jgi:neutral amino acid transport system ATP-binding protein
MSMHSTEPINPGSASDYMTDTRPIAAGETPPGCKKRDPIVVAENVTRSFGGINAVDVEYLEIPRHKITALIGPNGAGKTTLFNLLTGFDTPNSGKWQFEGKSIAGCRPTRWRAWEWCAPSSSPRSWAN